MLGDMIKKHTERLKKVVQVSGLLGAGIIFASSFINDHFVTAFQEDAQNLDAVENDEARIQSSIAASEDQLKAAENLIGLQVEVNLLSKKTEIEKLKDIFDAASTYLDTLESSVAILNESVDETADISNRTKLSEETKQAIQAVNTEIKTVSDSLQAENQTFKDLNEELKSVARAINKGKDLKEVSGVRAINKLASLQDTEGEENKDDANAGAEGDKPADGTGAEAGAEAGAGAEAATPSAAPRNPDEVIKDILAQMEKLDSLENQYKAAGENLNELFDKIDAEVKKEKESSESVSDVVAYFAYILSTIGAVLAGFGKWLEGRISGTGSLIPGMESEE